MLIIHVESTVRNGFKLFVRCDEEFKKVLKIGTAVLTGLMTVMAALRALWA